MPGGYLSLLYEHTLKALADAEVSVYPVDVRGLVSNSPAGDANYKGGLVGPAFARSITARGWLQTSTIDTLKEFADMTGGQAFYNSNDVEGGFHRAAQDSAEYYILTYYLNTRNTKAGWRQLKVTSSKSLHRLKIRARAGFFVTNATTRLETSRRLDIESAIASPFESTGLPMTVRWTGTAAEQTRGKWTSTFIWRAAASLSTSHTITASILSLTWLPSRMVSRRRRLGKSWTARLWRPHWTA